MTMTVDISKINKLEVAGALASYNGNDSFINSLKSAFNKYGSLTDKQLIHAARTLKVPSYVNNLPQAAISQSVHINQLPKVAQQMPGSIKYNVQPVQPMQQSLIDPLIIWVKQYTGNFPFLKEMKTRAEKGLKFSDKQLAAIKKCKDRDEKIKTRPVGTTQSKYAVTNGQVSNQVQKTTENLLITPTNVVVSRGVARGIKQANKLSFLPITLTVNTLHAQTDKAVEISARLTTGTVHICRCCGASLTDWKSQATGMGPVCSKKLGVKYITKKSDIARFQKELEERVKAIGDLRFWAPKSKFKEGIENLKNAIKQARALQTAVNTIVP